MPLREAAIIPEELIAISRKDSKRVVGLGGAGEHRRRTGTPT